MNDYLLSRDLEVQQRAFEYKFLRDNHQGLGNNIRGLIFSVPLTENQVATEALDFSMGFLDGVVQQQLAEGKPDYDQEKASIISGGGEYGKYTEEGG